MIQFERLLYPTTALDLSAVTEIDSRAHTTPHRTVTCSSHTAAVSPSMVLPMETPLFSPFRSNQSIKEDQMHVLSTLAERRLGPIRRAPFVAETLPDPLQRSTTSFDGRRDVAHSNQAHPIAQSLFLFIDDALGRIFPPLPERDSVATLHCIDIRRSVARLPYKAHTRMSFELEMERAEQRSKVFSEGRGASTSLPKSPFGEASSNKPPAHVYHPPAGLEVMLERIERRDIFHGPWLDPAMEMSSRADPPMSRESREDSSSKCIRSLLRTKRRQNRKLQPLHAQSGIFNTSAEKLHQNTSSIRQRMSSSIIASDAPLVIIEESAAPKSLGTRSQSVIGRTTKQQSVTFGDMLEPE
jgi:hypothetical protein